METLYNIVTEFIEITGNTLIDNILLWGIGILSFSIAFGIIGMIFDAIGIYDSDIMSDCHWLVRLCVFLGLSWLCIEVAKFINWLFSFQWWIYLIFGVILIAIVILSYWIKHKISKNKKCVEIDEQPKIEQRQELNVLTRDHCPRCGAMLVKRHGPYGNFYGCENFASKGCKYTRKFK